MSSSELRAALSDSAVRRIVLVAGTYEFDDDMPCKGGSAALCIDRDVTIEAEVAGSVVLDAKGARRVIYVSSAGRAELIGLSITGGAADKGGGVNIDGSADLNDCSIHDNVATDEVSPSAQIEPIACELPQGLLSSAPKDP